MQFKVIASAFLCISAEFPTPPVQTSVQQSVIHGHAKRAKIASEAATKRVLALFDKPIFRTGLQKCCPNSANLSSEELLTRFRQEVRAAELAHAFPSGFGSSRFTDLTIPLAEEFNWFLNEWQAPMTHNGTGEFLYNVAEENVFGCPPFRNDSKPTWKEAADRLIYVAHNMRQLDTGSLPVFGDVAAIFKKSYVYDSVLIAAVDTGLFEMTCNASAFPNKSKKPPIHLNMNCDAWMPPLVGTLDYFDHIIIPNLAVWASQFKNTIEEQAVDLFSRSAFAGDYLNLPYTTFMSATTYYEANVLANPRLPDGVSFLVGNFISLFGTDAGRELQLLADHFSWPLVWALGSKGPGMQNKKSALTLLSDSLEQEFPNPPYAGNQRILDPEVLATQSMNATVSPSARASFVQAWGEVANRRKNPWPISSKGWSQYWAALTTSQVRLAPLTARSGCVEDLCFGTLAVTGQCVCKQGLAVLV